MSVFYSDKFTGQMVSPDKFGAVGDGSTDDRQALQAWLDYYSSGIRYFILEPNKVYIVQSRLFIDSKNDWVLDLNGSTIKCGDSSPVDANGKALQISRASRWELKNGIIDGNRDNRGTAAQVPAHNIGIYDCDDFVINRITSMNARVDGFYLDEYTPGTASTSNYRGSFINCKTDNCTRQGCSVIGGHDIRFLHCSFINTNGLSPGAGIDIEADVTTSQPSNTNILIDGCYFNNNYGNAIQLSATRGAKDAIVQNCLLDGTNTEYTVSVTGVPTTTINASGHTFEDGMSVTFRTTNALPTGISVGTGYIVVNSTSGTFEITTTPGGSGITLTSSGTGTHTAGRGCETIRCDMPATITNNTFQNIISGRGTIDTGSGALGKAIVSNNKFINCSPSYRFASCVYQHAGSSGICIVSNNYAENCAGLVSDTAGDYTIVQGNIVNNPTRNWGGLASFATGALGGKIIGNTVFGANLNAIFLSSASDNHQCIISDNTILNTRNVGSNPTYGTIRVLTPHCLISNNTIHLDTAVTSAYGIVVGSSGSIITGNRVTGYSTSIPIYVSPGMQTRVDSTNYPQLITIAAAGDTTPSLQGALCLKFINSSGVTASGIDDGIHGDFIILHIDNNTTISNNANIKLDNSLNFTPPSGGTLSLINYSGVWYETARATF